MATGYRAVSKLGVAEPQYNIYIYIYVCVNMYIKSFLLNALVGRQSRQEIGRAHV